MPKFVNKLLFEIHGGNKKGALNHESPKGRQRSKSPVRGRPVKSSGKNAKRKS